MAVVYDETCEFVDVDPKAVRSIARRLDSCARDMAKLGLFHFGGSGSGSIRAHSPSHSQLGDRPYILADLGDNIRWDGGDGACLPDTDGHMRGEGTS